MLEKGQVIGDKYVIDYKIGDGGMGTVYSATHTALCRRDALKVMHLQFGNNHTFIERFFREARAMARLNHENIVRVFDVFEEKEKYFIAMEYFEGLSLKAILEKPQSVDVLDTLNIIRQAALALDYAHQQGIVHRDIKPGNILVNENHQVKLVDFGIAATLDEPTLTSTGQLMGSPPYMSPEQARGDRITESSDLFSLGRVFFELASGHNPFEGDSGIAIIGKLAYQKEEFKLDFPEDIDADIKTLIRALVRRDPQQRISSAIEVAHRIDTIINKYAGAPRDTTYRYPDSLNHLFTKTESTRSDSSGVTLQSILDVWKSKDSKVLSIAAILIVFIGAGLFFYYYSPNSKSPEILVENSSGSKTVENGKAGNEDPGMAVATQATALVSELLGLSDKINFAKQAADRDNAQQYIKPFYDLASDNQQQGMRLFQEGKSAIEQNNHSQAQSILIEAKMLLNSAYNSYLQMPQQIEKFRQDRAALNKQLDRLRQIRDQSKSARQKAVAANAAKHRQFKNAETQFENAESAFIAARDLLDKNKNTAAYEQIDKAEKFYGSAKFGFEQSVLLNAAATAQRIIKQAQNRLRKKQLEIIRLATEAETAGAQEYAVSEIQRAKNLADKLTHSSLIISDYVEQNKRNKAIKAIDHALVLAGETKAAYLNAARIATAGRNKNASVTSNTANPNSVSGLSKPTVNDIEAVEALLYNFKKAYEAKDLNKLKILSDLSDWQLKRLRQIFRDFSDIDVEIVGYSLNGDSANARARINKLKNANGDIVTPADSWRTNHLVIKKENGRWKKITWQ